MRTTMIAVAACVGLSAVALGLTLLDHAIETGGRPIPDLAIDFLDRLLLIGAAVLVSVTIMRMARLRRRTDELEQDIQRAAREGRAWRAQSRRFLDGLSRSVETQFNAWDLTPAESDVAGLLLKGASLREIAQVRRTSEATIRQQAGNVYRKSGLSSRAELSAYFLEDLFAFGEVSVGGTEPRPEGRFDA